MTLTLVTKDRYETAAQEDRCAPRIALSIPATMRASGEKAFPIKVTDLSIAGFAVDVITGLHPGTICWLTLPGLSALQAEIVWNSGNAIGCAFADLLNPAVLGSLIARYA